MSVIIKRPRVQSGLDLRLVLDRFPALRSESGSSRRDVRIEERRGKFASFLLSFGGTIALCLFDELFLLCRLAVVLGEQVV